MAACLAVSRRWPLLELRAKGAGESSPQGGATLRLSRSRTAQELPQGEEG